MGSDHSVRRCKGNKGLGYGGRAFPESWKDANDDMVIFTLGRPLPQYAIPPFWAKYWP